jgi:hypothetical protein
MKVGLGLRWMIGTVAIAMLAGCTTAHHLAASDRSSTSSSPAPSALATSPAHSSAPVHQASPTKPAQTPVTHPSPTHSSATYLVALGGARISLPTGWVARDYHEYLVPPSGTLAAQQWCITPASLPARTKPGSCPLTLGTIPPNGNPVDVDTQGGWSSNPEYCGQSPSTESEQSGDRDFGGRMADWRSWQIKCATGKQWNIEQDVVATGPGFILFSDQVDAAVHDTMSEIIANSTLPAQSLPVRFDDYGYIRSAVATSSGVRIALDRVVRGYPNRNVNPQTYTYVIPTNLYNAAHAHVGSLAALYSNGRTISEFYVDPPR